MPTGSLGTQRGRSGTLRMFSRKILGRNTSFLSSMDSALSTQTMNTSENFLNLLRRTSHSSNASFLGTRCVPLITAARDRSMVAVKPGWWKWWKPQLLTIHIQAWKLGLLGRGGGSHEIFCDEVYWGPGDSSSSFKMFSVLISPCKGLLEWSSAVNNCPSSLWDR